MDVKSKFQSIEKTIIGYRFPAESDETRELYIPVTNSFQRLPTGKNPEYNVSI